MRTLPRFPDWRQINAQALVTGTRADGPGGNLSVEFRLWDVFAGEQMRGLRYDAPESTWRRIGHKIADVIYERLTGEPGYFDTRIAYVAETGPATRRVKRIARHGPGRRQPPLPDRRQLPGADPAVRRPTAGGSPT